MNLVTRRTRPSLLLAPALALALAATSAAQDVHCSEQHLLAPPGIEFWVTNASPSIVTAEDLTVIPEYNGGHTRLHTYQRVPGVGWEHRGELSVPETGTEFGSFLHLSREDDGAMTLLVSEHKWKNASGVERGCVRVYRWDPVQLDWDLLQQLFPPDTGFIRYGFGLDRDGDWLVVSSQSGPQDLYLSRRDPNTGTWSYDQRIVSGGPGFSQNVALGGEWLAATRSGFSNATRMYRLDANGDWLHDQDAPLWMWNLRMVGDELLGRVTVSVPGTGISTGQVKVLRRDAGSGLWQVEQELDSTAFPPGTLQVGDGFYRFDVSEDLLVAGGGFYDPPGGPENAGRVYAFVRGPGGDWVPLGTLDEGSGAEDYGHFGDHVAVDGMRAVIVANPNQSDNDTAWSVDLDPTDCDGNLVPDACQVLQPLNDRNLDGVLDVCQQVGTVYCAPAQPNSTGAAGRIGGLGSAVLADEQLDVCADRLPPNEFGYLLASSATGLTVPPGSAGVLCLGGGADLGRYVDQVASSGTLGLHCTTIDLPRVPTATGLGLHVLQPGETWYFQYWHRDGTTSNFTSALEVVFQ